MAMRGRSGILFLLLAASALFAQKMSPGDFWKNLIKGPLGGPKADEYFERTLRDASLPGSLAPYLEGSLVSFTSSKGEIRLLLSIEGNDKADVILVMGEPDLDDAQHERLVRAIRGTLVRFSGAAASKFTKEPFMLTFETFGRHSRVEIVEPR